MAFFTEAINVLKVLVIALGAGLAVWDDPGANGQGCIRKHQQNQ